MLVISVVALLFSVVSLTMSLISYWLISKSVRARTKILRTLELTIRPYTDKKGESSDTFSTKKEDLPDSDQLESGEKRNPVELTIIAITKALRAARLKAEAEETGGKVTPAMRLKREQEDKDVSELVKQLTPRWRALTAEAFERIVEYTENHANMDVPSPKQPDNGPFPRSEMLREYHAENARNQKDEIPSSKQPDLTGMGAAAVQKLREYHAENARNQKDEIPSPEQPDDDDSDPCSEDTDTVEDSEPQQPSVEPHPPGCDPHRADTDTDRVFPKEERITLDGSKIPTREEESAPNEAPDKAVETRES